MDIGIPLVTLENDEWKAEPSSHALRSLLQIRAAVYRDGDVREINAEDVVPGDVVWLESGNRVPADIRLLSGLAHLLLGSVAEYVVRHTRCPVLTVRLRPEKEEPLKEPEVGIPMPPILPL